MCQVLTVSVSGYYTWCQQPPSDRAKVNQQLLQQIKVFYQRSHSAYGSTGRFRINRTKKVGEIGEVFAIEYNQ